MVLSHKVQVANVEGKGKGIVAVEKILPGERVWWWDKDEEPIYTYTKSELINAEGDMGIKLRMYSYMIEKDVFASISKDPSEHMCDSYYFNHSCNPSCWFEEGGNILVTIGEVCPGQELAYDYATTESSQSIHAGMTCNCQSPECRGVLSGKEYLNKNFWNKYDDHMAEYLQRMVNELRDTSEEKGDKINQICSCS
mmetsp:Transcript_25119/g.32628  ORF Transcript_25119/g.32628 Transcript_25119/m.32628 type:complete len:196 (-) Transcript_25119:119-706(-)|eukprot:CAMPEP_0117763160 /NCGR_PEP_ID=MMETSP0947-20121206/18448_1 /TAXON_ID=44440 /ORGANISM="Chattonella subsalsa, Strain CCMP2191" /LENGTH=195 /DNA_ID=CAMNT_0005584765 /DNA_START=98 /DNA_END=685 /DNA_ORIENTATION=+